MATNYKPDAESVSMFADELPGLRAFDPDHDQQGESAARRSGMEVRSYRLFDSSSVGKFPIRYELHHPESDSDRPGTMQLATRALVAGETSNKPLYVAVRSASGERLGALQCEQRGSDERWSLQYLAVAEPASRTNPAPVAMLEYAIAQAGKYGARRIMARSEVESGITGALRASGFTAFAHETLYVLPQVPASEPGRAVRIQEKSDVWDIHQLYMHTTPREVQSAEALTSHAWDLDLEGRSRRGWLICTEAGTVGYVRVKTARRFHRLDVMFLPEAIAELPALLGTVFAALRVESPRPTYVAVRGYQQELASALAPFDFELNAEQLLMVRYTTVPVPARAAEAFELLRPAEADARRVPSFYVRDVHE